MTSLGKFQQALVAGAAAFVALSAFFVATMLLNYRAIDIPYLLFAEGRILCFSLVVALALLMWKRVTFAMASLLGAVLGLAGAAIYVGLVS